MIKAFKRHKHKKWLYKELFGAEAGPLEDMVYVTQLQVPSIWRSDFGGEAAQMQHIIRYCRHII